MSLKAELETWQAALHAASPSSSSPASTTVSPTPPDIPRAIALFENIAGTSKIEWNIGALLVQLGKHQQAIARFKRATEMDGWLVIAWVQMGVSRFMLKQYEAAHKAFDTAYNRMRGNDTIEYTQLGLAYSLHASEILFNRGLSSIYLGDVQRGMVDLSTAREGAQQTSAGTIQNAIRDRGKGYGPFSAPAGTLFTPPKGKLENLKPRDYIGKAVLIAATSPSDAFTSFTGVTRLRRGETPSGALLPSDHPAKLSRSATLATAPPLGHPARSASVSEIPDRAGAAVSARMLRGKFGSMDETSPMRARFAAPQGTSGLAYLQTQEKEEVMMPYTASPASIYAPSDSFPPDFYLPSLTNPPRKAPTPPGLARLIIPSPQDSLVQTPENALGLRMQDVSIAGVSELIDDYYTTDNDEADERVRGKATRTGNDRLRALYSANTTGSSGSGSSSVSPGCRARGIEQWEKEGLDRRDRGRHRQREDGPVKLQLPVSAPPPMGVHDSGSSSPSLRTSSTASATSSFFRSMSIRNKPAERGVSRKGSQSAGAKAGYGDERFDKIRIKIHIVNNKTTRAMALSPSSTLSDLLASLHAKFPSLHVPSPTPGSQAAQDGAVRFKDEDGDMVALVDEGDWEAGVEVARARGGRLEIWVQRVAGLVTVGF